jgi:anti-sigma-K factor RskA
MTPAFSKMDIADKIALYALDALEADEAREFKQLVAASPDLQRRVAEERTLTASFALLPDAIMPTPALKQRLMTQIDAEAAPLSARLDAAARDRAASNAVAPRESRSLRDLLRGLTLGLAGLATATALILGYSLLQTQSQLAQSRVDLESAKRDAEARAAENTALSSDNAALEKQVTSLELARGEVENARKTLDAQMADAKKRLDETQARLDESTKKLGATQGEATQASDALKSAQTDLTELQEQLAILTDPDVRVSALPSSKTGYTGSARVYYTPTGKRAVITVDGLPALKSDLCYQLWLIDGPNPLPSVVLKTNDAGSGSTTVPSDLIFSEYEKFGITVEKAGGNPTPNPEGPVYLGDA